MGQRNVCLIAVVLCLFAMSWLSGCGGGGAAPPPPPPPAPTISSLSPNPVVAAGPDFTLTVTGANFVSSSTVQFNGSNRPTTFVSSSQLQATIGAADIALGAVNQITVANPASSGGVSAGLTLTVNNPTPVVTAVSPIFTVQGSGGLTLTVTGTGFLPISTIQLNGSARATTFVSNSTLQTAITAADAATPVVDHVVVANPVPGGGASNAQNFTVTIPAPIITRLTPSSAVMGGGNFTVTITGKGFNSGATVQFNGNPRATTFVSQTELQAQITAADISTIGISLITVANPITTSLVAGSQALNSPTSAPATFFTGTVGGPGFAAVTINQSAQDLVADNVNQAIYLSVASTAATNPNSITAVNLATATVGKSVPAGTNPRVLAISGDSQFLYAGIDGASTVQRFTLPALAADISYSLGSGSFGPFVALDLQVAPGSPHTTAVTLGSPSVSPEAEGGITIFDDAAPRPVKAPGFGGTGDLFASIQWGADANTLYAANNEDTGFDFYTLSVNPNGVTLNKDFGGTFGSFANTIHFDSGTKLVYGDEGHAVVPSSGTFAGHFTAPGIDNIMVADSSLNAAYFAGTTGSGVTITAFDLAHFTQGAQISVPASGGPIHLIRWGTDGLAFNTSGGQIVVLAGNFLDPVVSPSAVPPPNPTPTPAPTPTAQTPTINSLAPSATVVGGPAFTLTVNGSRFDPAAQVLFNGSPRTTTVVSGTQLQAAINAADIAKLGVSQVSVANPAANGGVSSPSTFFTGTTAGAGFVMTVLNQQVKDIVYDPSRQFIYLSVPEAAANGNTISVLDLSTTTIPFFQFAGSDPNLLSISSDNQFLYASLDGATSVQRFTLPTLAPDISYNLGRDSFFGPLFALDLQAAPGAPHTTAVALGAFGVSPDAQGPVTIFDDATPRATTDRNDINVLQWGADASTLFAASQLGQDLLSLAVNASGVTQAHDFITGTGDARFHFDPTTNHVYFDGGKVVDASTGSPVGLYAGSGIMVPDPRLNAAFFLSGSTLQAFDLTRFTLAGSISIPGVSGTPQHLIRWGQNGLAFHTDAGQIVLIAGNFLSPIAPPNLTPPPNTPPPAPPTPTAQTPTIASLVPSSAVSGGPSFTLTVNGTNFDPAAQIQFNGTLLTTNVVSSTQLTATIGAGSIAAAGVSNVTVVNPAANGGPSLPATFFVGDVAGTSTGGVAFSVQIVNQASNDMVFDPVNQLIYLSVPGSAGVQGNTISAVDLATASVPFAQFAGSEPGKLAISQDSQFLYAGIDGSSKVQRFTLPGLGTDITLSLSADQFGPVTALDLQAAPRSPHTTAVTTGNKTVSPAAQGGITIFDDLTARPTAAPGFSGTGHLFDSLQWGADATTLFAANDDDSGDDFYTLAVNSSGVTLSHDFFSAFSTFPGKIHYDPVTNLIYADNGQILNPAGAVVASFSTPAGTQLRVTPDGLLNKAFVVSQTFGASSVTIESFNLTTHALIDSLTVVNVQGNVVRMLRWGTNGLALNTTGGQILLVGGSFVQ